MNKTIRRMMRIGFSILAKRGLTRFVPDRTFLKWHYYFSMNRFPDLDHPTTFNEKLQWLKLYNRRPEYTVMADKYRVREYVEEKIGKEYLNPLLGVWESPDEIDFDRLPEKFVLKCNHDSGSTVICKEKSGFDRKKAVRFLKKRLRTNYFWMGREWPYKNIERRVIAERYMTDGSGSALKDYKFFCFNGRCKALYIATDRGTDTRYDFYDRDFHHLPLVWEHPNADKELPKPENFDEMIRIAEILSEGIPLVRVDLYDICGRICFGELTFFHAGGVQPLEPESFDELFGSWIRLPDQKIVE